MTQRRRVAQVVQRGAPPREKSACRALRAAGEDQRSLGAPATGLAQATQGGALAFVSQGQRHRGQLQAAGIGRLQRPGRQALSHQGTLIENIETALRMIARLAVVRG